MRRVRRITSNDDGVSLVMALVFIVIVALFASVALDKTSSTTVAGQQLRDRGDLQYALDAAVERALQVLKDDITSSTTTNPASLCTSPPATAGTEQDITQESPGLDINGQLVRYTCETLAGSTTASGSTVNTNFALILTGQTTNALTTQAGQAKGQSATCTNAGAAIKLGGSVYLSGVVNDSGVTKRILVCGGDLVSHYAGCTDTAAKAVTNLIGDPNFLKTCTDQDVDEAVVDIALPEAPTGDNAATIPLLNSPLFQDVQIGNGNNAPVCRVFYPGRYADQPDLLTAQRDGNYFISGLYSFDFAANDSVWSIGGNTTVTAGAPQGQDVDADGGSTACDTVDTLASDAGYITGLPTLLPSIDTTQVSGAHFPTGGATFVFEGTSRVEVAGYLTIRSTTATPAIGMVAARGTTDPGQIAGQTDVDRGYGPWSGNNPVISNQSANSGIVVNGKLMAPSAPVELFASNPTTGVVRGGVVAKTLDIAASVQGGGLAISTPASSVTPAPPPFRTVRIVAKDANGNSATNVAVAKISNYDPFTVTVLSWRTN